MNPTKSVEIRTIDLRGRSLSKSQYQAELPRAEMDVDAAVIAIKPILERVAKATEADLIELGKEFDGIAAPSIRVPKAELVNALAKLDPAIRSALEEAIRRVRIVHKDHCC